jgi:hypothetical protein
MTKRLKELKVKRVEGVRELKKIRIRIKIETRMH